MIPAADPSAPGENPSTRSFPSDKRLREAVMAHESEYGRIPQRKADDEEGHDIDSYVREKGSLGRKLARRIEVKGKKRCVGRMALTSRQGLLPSGV